MSTLELVLTAGFIIVIIELLICIMLIRSRNEYSSISSDEYTVCFYSLEQIVKIYKPNFFDPELQRLNSTYDINVNSQTNAIKTYNEEYKKLLSSTAQTIIRSHIPQQTFNVLAKYMTYESLTLYIINILEGKQ